MDYFEECLQEVTFPGFHFVVGTDGERSYLQIDCPEGKCNFSGDPYPWKGRKWFLSPHMCKSEVITTAFKAVMTAIEHEARETFLYKGRAIFGPHISVDRLWELCDGEHEETR